MKQNHYINERDALLNTSNDKKIPTRAFCREFLKRLPDTDTTNKSGFHNDDEDYYAWGMALFGDWQNGEREASYIDIWNWIEFYEAKENDDINSMLRVLKEIKEYRGLRHRLYNSITYPKPKAIKIII